MNEYCEYTTEELFSAIPDIRCQITSLRESFKMHPLWSSYIDCSILEVSDLLEEVEGILNLGEED